MALTYGFYNSLNGDRKYNAKQFGSIFDGVIHDGVYINIGGQMMVKAAGNGMQINIQTGRAWFNHTWTLNDSIFPMTLPNAEPLLSKYVAVVLEINETVSTRANSFKLVTGTPASSPVYPTLINTDSVHQYALAYVLIRPGVEAITQANIINNVGKRGCPFVTSVAASMNIDDLIARWEAQWNQWINAVNSEYLTFKDNWDTWFADTKSDWTSYIQQKTDEFDTFLGTQLTRVSNFITAQDARIDDFLDDKDAQFTALFSNMRDQAQQYFDDSSTAWNNWFQHYQDELSSSQAANLQAQIDAISFIYVIGETLFLPNTSVSVQNERATFTNL